ncbi:hypothetical protein RJ641_030645 [Dillenia turbinata]|uniref:CCHC-type domain-containing protein n=1 Tax=Dillenia turbinata TaxID=194707 RepID=A0AAN8ZHA4_9MAGN
MAKRPDLDDDDDFSELYKEYTGPPGTTTNNVQDKSKVNKRAHASSDEEEQARDPNAVPTDFTSREAKVWEAKSKATERNWKKRKEEEMICKICGESGHFTQGCPSTLGANRKSQDFFERVPARESHVKALFTEKVIQKIEKDIGCKIKVEEKFIIVSGKDRLCLAKGVDAVHKVKEEGDKTGPSSSPMSGSRSPERSPVSSQLGRSDSQRSHSSPRNTSRYPQKFGRQEKVVEDNSQKSHSSPRNTSRLQHRFGRQEKVVEDDSQKPHPSPRNASQFSHRFGRQEKVVEDRVREDLHKLSRENPQGRNSLEYSFSASIETCKRHKTTQIKCLMNSSFDEAYGNDGARGRPSHSRSPARPPYTGNSCNTYDGRSQNMYRTEGWDSERQGSKMQSGHNLDYSALPQTLEDLELEYKKEAMDLARIRDKEEDEENYKHRERCFIAVHVVAAAIFCIVWCETCVILRSSKLIFDHSDFVKFKAIREMRENYMKKVSALRVVHAKKWEEFLQHDAQRQQQRARQHISTSGFGGYKLSRYSEYDSTSSNPHYVGSNLPMDSRGRYPNPIDNYSARPHGNYGEFPRQRREDFGKAYNRY